MRQQTRDTCSCRASCRRYARSRASPARCQLVEVLARPAGADRSGVQVGDAVDRRHRSGRAPSGWPRTTAAPSRSSPAPWIRGWLASTCSIRVVPDRGRPKTKTGRRVSSPGPPNLGEPVGAERSDESGRRIARGRPERTASAVLVLPGSRHWPGAGSPRRGRIRRENRGHAPVRTGAGRAPRDRARDRPAVSRVPPRSASGSLPRNSVASRAVRHGVVRLDPQAPRGSAVSASAISPSSS